MALNKNFVEGLSARQETLCVSEIDKSFGGLTAVDNLTFSVFQNEIFGIIGPNGAGKTTTLNLICGFLKPNKGSIKFTDIEINGLRPYEIAGLGIARTYQNVRLFEGLSVIDNITSGFYLQRSSTIFDSITCSTRDRTERKVYREKARALMEKVGLRVNPDHLAVTLSYGDQRRVEIARALAVTPLLLLLDEPTAGMNASETEILGDLFRGLRSDGITLIIIEHNMRMILNYCDRTIVMNFGKLLTTGTPRDCVDDPEVREAYFGKASNVKGY